MSARNSRTAVAKSLRELAAFIESNPELPLPAWEGALGFRTGANWSPTDEPVQIARVRRWAEILGVEVATSISATGKTHWSATRNFGAVEVGISAITDMRAADVPPSPPEEVAGPDVAAAGPATWPEEAAYWTEDADGDPIIPNATAPSFELGPLPDERCEETDETPFQREMRTEGVEPDFDPPAVEVGEAVCVHCGRRIAWGNGLWVDMDGDNVCPDADTHAAPVEPDADGDLITGSGVPL